MAVTDKSQSLTVLRAAQLDIQQPQRRWLIQNLWGRAGVGLIGGAPKCCKSWLGLDMAMSVASATPCLGLWHVDDPGPALIYLAEDSLEMVRARIDALCLHRRVPIDDLDLHVISTPCLRLDLDADQQRLTQAVDRIRPRMLLLDPLVRIHRLDENSAADISLLLGYLRQLQRKFDTAVVVVHHASKKHRAQPGQALRGSGDLHAFGDDNAYLARKNDHLVLTIEHRAAPAPEPLDIHLISRPDSTGTHLEPCSPMSKPENGTRALADAVVNLLEMAVQPLYRTTIRRKLRVNNQRLGNVLGDLERQRRIVRTPDGWCLDASSSNFPADVQVSRL